MTNSTVTATIEILGKIYSIKCDEAELASLQQAAEYLNEKVTEIQNASNLVLPERIAIMAALNISNEFLQLSQQKHSFMHKVNQRIVNMQNKLDKAIGKALQTELNYTHD